MLEKDFEGEIIFRLNNIYLEKYKKSEYVPRSIAVAKEVLVKEIIEFQSLLEEYPVYESDEGVDKRTRPTCIAMSKKNI